MECRHVRIKLPGYLDGDLLPSERRPLEDHLAECPECRAEWEELRGFTSTLQEFVVCPGPAYSFEALRRRLATIEPLEEVVAFLPRLRVNGLIPRFAVATLLLLLVNGGPFALRNSRQLYTAMKIPFSERHGQIDDSEKYLDEMDRAYREQMVLGMDADSVLPPGRNEQRKA